MQATLNHPRARSTRVKALALALGLTSCLVLGFAMFAHSRSDRAAGAGIREPETAQTIQHYQFLEKNELPELAWAVPTPIARYRFIEANALPEPTMTEFSHTRFIEINELPDDGVLRPSGAPNGATRE